MRVYRVEQYLFPIVEKRKLFYVVDSKSTDATLSVQVYDTISESFLPLTNNTVTVWQIQNLYKTYRSELGNQLKMSTGFYSIEGSENVSWIIHESGNVEFSCVAVSSHMLHLN